MLSSNISDLSQLFERGETLEKINLIDASPLGKPLPWLDDIIILATARYLLLEQCLSQKAPDLATKIFIVDSQETRKLVNHPAESNQATKGREAESIEYLRHIYREYSMIIHPVNLEDHWFLIVYSGNTFRVYDSRRTGASENVMVILDTVIFGTNSSKRREVVCPASFQRSYWECGYFVCSVLRDLILRCTAEKTPASFPTDLEIRSHIDQGRCYEMSRRIVVMYKKCNRFFLQ
jgi:hypothetical protein